MSTIRNLGNNGVPSGFRRAFHNKPSVGFVSTYPPTICGLATFTASLRKAMAERRGGDGSLVVAELLEGSSSNLPRPEVIASIDTADRLSMRLGAERLSSCDAVILQHEYGIWGPEMGRPVIDLANRIEAPLITTLHTVLPSPTDVQAEIIEVLARKSIFTVVPTQAASDQLCARYEVDPASVAIIPHGTDPLMRPLASLQASPSMRTEHPRLLSWGLIGPGKGLEWAVRAVNLLRKQYPGLVYTIAGKTHPKVVRHEGEAYRSGLEVIVSELGLEENVRFVDEYITSDLLAELLIETTLVVIPYDSTEQVVSGVLVEAVAANVPVVATAFPHAIEMARHGAVTTVPHRSPHALATKIAHLLESPSARERMLAAQRAIAPGLDWSSVAAEYELLVGKAVSGSEPIRHVSPAS